MAHFIGIFCIDVVFKCNCTELGEILGRDLNQVRYGGLVVLEKVFFYIYGCFQLTRINMATVGKVQPGVL